MAVAKIDPKVIFASEAPAQDTPAVFTNKTVGLGESRKNGGRPTIKQSNALQQETDLKILWLNENAVLPYDLSIDYPDGAVTLKDGSFKQLSSGSWVEFLDDFADKDAVKRGIANRYDSTLAYNMGERVVLANGDIVKSTVDGNANDPNVDMTGWIGAIDAAFVVDGDKNQKQINDLNKDSSYLFKPSSALDHTTELQAAIDYCAANFLNCKPIGLFKTSGKVVIKGEFDGSRCRVQTQVYGPITATPIAVEVSTGIGDNPTTIISLTEAERIILPDVVNGTKPVTGWAGQGIGVRYVNVQNTKITERLVQDFAIGVQHTSYNQGCGYCTVDAGYLRNNKVNRQFTVGNDTGFTNRWDLIGGRYFHASAEGIETEGVMHFDVVPNTTGKIINDINHFGGSFEGITEQYHLRLGGSHINFWGIRFETSENNAPGGIKVHLASGGIAGQGSACGIHFGRGVAADIGDIIGVVRVTSDPSAGRRLTIQSTSGTTFKSVAGTSEIKQSTNSPADFLYSGVDPLYVYGQSITANYSFGILANELKAKRRTDAHDRVKIDFQNGRVYFGTGAIAPTYYVGQQGGGSLATNANWIPRANAEHTLGATGFAWDRLFLAKGFGAFGVAPLSTQPTITGKKTPTTIAEQNAVLDSIVAALTTYGLVSDGRTV